MTINEIQEEIVEEFAIYEDWMDKYECIIDLGKELEELDDAYKIEENIVKGCQSRVWLHAFMKDGKLFFGGDSDAIITKGLVGLMIRVLSGHEPTEIANADLYFVDKIGLQQHLSPNRSNGLVSMIKKMKIYGLAHSAVH